MNKLSSDDLEIVRKLGDILQEANFQLCKGDARPADITEWLALKAYKAALETDGNVLPELPDGWVIWVLTRQTDDDVWYAEICIPDIDDKRLVGKGWTFGNGKSPRESVLAAIAKIQGKDGGL